MEKEKQVARMIKMLCEAVAATALSKFVENADNAVKNERIACGIENDLAILLK
jgi:hypothetical protein